MKITVEDIVSILEDETYTDIPGCECCSPTVGGREQAARKIMELLNSSPNKEISMKRKRSANSDEDGKRQGL